jgi:stress response protein YsnF
METVVAMYSSRVEAERVKERLIASGIASSKIALSPEGSSDSTVGQQDDRSWWDWLFGSNVPDDHRDWYGANLRDGRTAVSVYLDDTTRRSEVQALLHEHGALDPELATGEAGPGITGQADRTRRDGEEVIPVVKEELEVGKRQREDRYHVRVYTTERPVQETVNLRDERVIIERRPASGRAAGTALPEARDFEVVERHEEPVVAKTGRVTEEVIVRKDSSERTETVEGNVRETHVDVDKPTGQSTPNPRADRA